MTDADRLIDSLGLVPHPEGGWYRETWAAPGPERALATCIHFLLKAGERSHWHRVDADEIWLWHAGAVLTLSLSATDTGPATDHALGGQVLEGQSAQIVVPAGHWQSARSTGAYSLVSCIVSPGFRFDGFTLAPRDFDIPRL
ncbi:MAG: cupin domain-containing protein [Pseudorhodobacter sp.]